MAAFVEKCRPLADKLERFFWIFLFINPCLDTLNGFYLKEIAKIDMLDVEFATGSVTPTLVIRMVVLLVFAFYLLIIWDKRAILTVLPMGIAFVMSLVGEFRYFGSISVFTDLQYMARYGYNILVLFVYSHLFANMSAKHGRDKFLAQLDNLIALSIVILCSSILVSFATGRGYDTYADKLGYRGFRGYFYAGNDITAILLLLTPLSMATYMRMDLRKLSKWQALRYVAPTALAANCMLIIATKTAFIALAVGFAGLFLFSLYSMVRGDGSEHLYRFMVLFTVTLALFAILDWTSLGGLLQAILISLDAMEANAEDIVMFALSGRQIKFGWQLNIFKRGGIFTWLFGFGRGGLNLAENIPWMVAAEYVKPGEIMYILEMDVFEVLFYYGIFGILSMLWLYAKVAIDFIRAVAKRIDAQSFALFISLALCAGYLIMAGHVLFSVTSGFYFIFVIAYSRAYLSKKPEDVPVFRPVPPRRS